MHWTLGCDAADPQALASFWAFALGYVKEPGFDEPDYATTVREEFHGQVLGHVIMQDPEGNGFCVA